MARDALLNNRSLWVLVWVQVHSRDDKNRLVVTLFQEEDANSISELLLLEGLARVSKTEARKVDTRVARGVRGADKDKELLTRFQAAQNAAKSERKNIWRYGDAPDSDDERV